MQPAPYQPRETQSSVLVGLLREHLDDFLERASGTGAHPGLPRFVERQLRAMVDCGDVTRGVIPGSCAPARRADLLSWAPRRPVLVQGAPVRVVRGPKDERAGRPPMWIARFPVVPIGSGC